LNPRCTCAVAESDAYVTRHLFVARQCVDRIGFKNPQS
jgi:hypothetical protein